MSWGLALTAALQVADIVCDPCCGTGSLLVEAREYWPGVEFIGFDIDIEQLHKAALNIKAANQRGEGRCTLTASAARETSHLCGFSSLRNLNPPLSNDVETTKSLEQRSCRVLG